jgi:hypothetical protein
MCLLGGVISPSLNRVDRNGKIVVAHHCVRHESVIALVESIHLLDWLDND